MGHDQRYRRRPFASLMNEVDFPLVRRVPVMFESRQTVELRLPVKLISPIATKIDKELAIESKCPIRFRHFIGPARSLEAIAEVPHGRLRELEVEILYWQEPVLTKRFA